MHLSVGNGESALPESTGPTGKRSAVKVARSVWSGGKAVKPYLSLPPTAQRKELKDNPTLYVRERLDYSACVWEVMFLAGIFLINLRQTPRMVFYQEKIPHKTLSGGIGRKSLPL